MTESTVVDRNLDEIEKSMPKASFDTLSYEGKRVKIDKVMELEVTDFYAGEGGTYDTNSIAKKHVISVVTEPLPKLDDKGEVTETLYRYFDEVANAEKTVTVDIRLGLKLDKTTDMWVISKHPKAKLWKFMRKMGVEKLSELKGKFVTLTAEPSSNPDDDRSYLRIAI